MLEKGEVFVINLAERYELAPTIHKAESSYQMMKNVPGSVVLDYLSVSVPKQMKNKTLPGIATY